MNLTVTVLFLEVTLMLLPGFIWWKVHRAFGVKSEANPFDVVLNSFIYSIITYLALALIYRLFGLQMHIIDIQADEKRIVNPQVLPEIVEAVALSLTLSIVWLYVVNYKILTRLLQTIKATRTYGDEDVWDYIFNSSSPLVNFVHVRDFEQQVVYAGDVRIFSETEKMRELLLENVVVYDFDGNRLYGIPSMYLSRNPEGLHIEFPSVASQIDEVASYRYTFPAKKGSADDRSP